MTNLTEYLKRHQLIAYFVLTYVFSWALWIPLQQLVLDGQNSLMPLISLGVFAPALVGIGLSAILKPRPRQGSRKPAVIAFIVVWILASVIIIMDLIVIRTEGLVHTFSGHKCYNWITAGFCRFFCLFHDTGCKSSSSHVYKAKGRLWLLSPGACFIPCDLAPGKSPESCPGNGSPIFQLSCGGCQAPGDGDPLLPL